MPISIEILPREPVEVTAPSAPAPGPIIDAHVVQPAGRGRDGRPDTRSDRGASFRTTLDAVTFNGVISGSDASSATAEQPQVRAAKLPDTSTPAELAHTEASGLLGATQASWAATETKTPEERVHRAAARQYAQAFFADTRTFARPGDSLEVSA